MDNQGWTSLVGAFAAAAKKPARKVDGKYVFSTSTAPPNSS